MFIHGHRASLEILATWQSRRTARFPARFPWTPRMSGRALPTLDPLEAALDIPWCCDQPSFAQAGLQVPLPILLVVFERGGACIYASEIG